MSGEGHRQFQGQVRVVPEPGHGQSEMQYFSESQTFPTLSLPQSLLSILSPISELLESHSESCCLCPYLQEFFLCFTVVVSKFQVYIKSFRHFLKLSRSY
jgi:hypothetical protein